MGSLYGTVLLAGIANAVEPGQNGTLARVMGEPLLAGSLCFGLALLCTIGALSAFLTEMLMASRGIRDQAARMEPEVEAPDPGDAENAGPDVTSTAN